MLLDYALPLVVTSIMRIRKKRTGHAYVCWFLKTGLGIMEEWETPELHWSRYLTTIIQNAALTRKMFRRDKSTTVFTPG